MDKISSALACTFCHAVCSATDINVGGVSLHNLLTMHQNIDKYYKTLGQIDYALEDAIIRASACESTAERRSRQGARKSFEQHGKDVLSEHDEHARQADDLYKIDTSSSIKSSAHGAPHAIGKHMQMLDQSTSVNDRPKRAKAIDLYEYMSDDDRLTYIHKKINSKTDITADKRPIIDLIMKYLTVARILQDAESFASATYQKDNSLYSGLAFFTQKIRYNAGNQPELLFVPVKHARPNQHAYVASIYPLGSISRLCYKLNPGTHVDMKNGNITEIKDIPNNIKTLITWPKITFQPAIQTISIIETKPKGMAYETIYKNTINPLKIRLDGNVYNVTPVLQINNTVQQTNTLNIPIDAINGFLQNASRKTAQLAKKSAIFSHCANKTKEILKSTDNDLLFALTSTATKIKESEMRIKCACAVLKLIKENDAFNKFAEHVFTSEETATEEVYSFVNKFVLELFSATVEGNFEKLFIECFYETLDDHFFQLFPDAMNILDKANQSIKMIVRKKSPSVKKYFHNKILKEFAAQRGEACFVIGERFERQSDILLQLLKAEPKFLQGVKKLKAEVSRIVDNISSANSLKDKHDAWMNEADKLPGVAVELKRLFDAFSDEKTRSIASWAKICQTMEERKLTREMHENAEELIQDIGEEATKILYIIELLASANKQQPTENICTDSFDANSVLKDLSEIKTHLDEVIDMIPFGEEVLKSFAILTLHMTSLGKEEFNSFANLLLQTPLSAEQLKSLANLLPPKK